MTYGIELAGILLKYRFRYKGTKELFENFIKEEYASDQNEVIEVTDEIWQRFKRLGHQSTVPEYLEFYILVGLTSRELLKYKRCIFHGTAFKWHGQVWILTAPSGAGKTTQYLIWKELFCDEIELINGDKPILEYKDDGTIWVYSSPWNGKENYQGSGNGPLGGIVYLEQSNHNEIQKMTLHKAMIPIYRQFLYYADNETEIKQVGEFEKKLLTHTPVWLLKNTGDKESVLLTYKALSNMEVSSHEKI